MRHRETLVVTPIETFLPDSPRSPRNAAKYFILPPKWLENFLQINKINQERRKDTSTRFEESQSTSREKQVSPNKSLPLKSVPLE